MICGFREYLVDRKYYSRCIVIKNSLFTVAICSSECERGCNSILSLLFIRTVGPPLSQFDSTGYVQSWLLCKHYAMATQTKLKQLKALQVWNVS
jgi:hypothetical protein